MDILSYLNCLKVEMLQNKGEFYTDFSLTLNRFFSEREKSLLVQEIWLKCVPFYKYVCIYKTMSICLLTSYVVLYRNQEFDTWILFHIVVSIQMCFVLNICTLYFIY